MTGVEMPAVTLFRAGTVLFAAWWAVPAARR